MHVPHVVMHVVKLQGDAYINHCAMFVADHSLKPMNMKG